MQQRAKQKLEQQLALMHEAFATLQQPSVPLDRMAESAGPVALDADEGDESEDEAGAGFDSPLGRGDPLEACSSLHDCFAQTSIFLKCQSAAYVVELCAEGCRRIPHSALPCSVVHGALASMLKSCIWLGL